ncbi:phospholipase D-like domain-containing protein [Sphingomonas endolithica]|uniref:phospholipase D-like domain-containing protein n=1 Tax=Sphingomonas endolithica TaxID=2972485 RepID=UPI0021AF60DD|nr:phospholipase D-like domain-containing protein [Sphingomonas sp. ZFBP2030]
MRVRYQMRRMLKNMPGGSSWRRSTKRPSRLWIAVPAIAGIASVTTLALIAQPEQEVGGGTAEPTIGQVYFGGPDKPAGVLRDLLLAKVRATPPGQSIDWATYYFLDSELAQALIDASRRGVKVRLVVEGDPRLAGANSGVLAMLRQAGLSNGLTIRRELPAPLDALSGKLHAKIYAFSWPRPVALVGSFNPSGGVDDDSAAIVREIGDQDRGHNVLVEITGRGLVEALVTHVADLARDGGAISRFGMTQNRVVRDRDTQLFFYPRLHTDIVEEELDGLGAGDRLWAAISHLKGKAVAALEGAARRGAAIHLVVHDTERRVPQDAVDRLTAQGVEIRRYRHADGLPMHDKIFVIERRDHWISYFGSLNFNRNSRFLNDEVLVRSTNAPLALALLKRFADIDRELDRQQVIAEPAIRSLGGKVRAAR